MVGLLISFFVAILLTSLIVNLLSLILKKETYVSIDDEF